MREKVDPQFWKDAWQLFSNFWQCYNVKTKLQRASVRPNAFDIVLNIASYIYVYIYIYIYIIYIYIYVYMYPYICNFLYIRYIICVLLEG